MKKQIRTLAGLVTVLASSSVLAEQTKVECNTVVEHLTQEVKKDSSRLLLAVEDSLTLNDKCACEIVSTAIKLSKADSDMVGRIVTTAVQAAPASASAIGECAMAAAPDSTASIKKAMKGALGQGDTEAAPAKKTAQGDITDDIVADADSAGKEVVGKEPVATNSGKDVVGKAPISYGKDKEVIPPVKGDTVDPEPSTMLNTAGVYLFTQLVAGELRWSVKHAPSLSARRSSSG